MMSSPAALVPLGIAGLITLGFAPALWALAKASGPSAAGAGIGLVFLSLFRAGFLALGLAMAQGGLTGIGATPAGRIFAVVLATLLVEVVSCGLSFGALDLSSGVASWASGILCFLLPALLLGVGVLSVWGTPAPEDSRRALAATMFWCAVGGSIAAGLGMIVVVDAERQASQLATQERWRVEEETREKEAAEAKRKSLAAVDAVDVRESGVAPLLEFTAAGQPDEVRQRALARIEGAEGWRKELTRIVGEAGSEHRLAALAVLTRDVAGLRASERDACWAALDAISVQYFAQIQGYDSPPPLDPLFRSALQLLDGDDQAMTRHREALAAVAKVVRRAEERKLIFAYEAWQRLSNIDAP